MSDRSVKVDHRLRPGGNVHTAWNDGLDPVLEVNSGDVVRVDCLDTVDDLSDIESIGHHLTGPISIRGVEPGDVLEVEILSVKHRGYGYTLFRPGERGSGLLPEAFPDPELYHWELDGDVGRFVRGIEVPLGPFPGVVGVAPEGGEHSTRPPRRVGGNLDVKHLTAGSTVYLPVEVEGGLFSVGDGHAAQGDGEVCVTAIEAPISVDVRLTRRTDVAVDAPQFRTTGPFTPTGGDELMYGTMGVADDLMRAAKEAVSAMIEHLHAERGLSRSQAYLLCSVAVDLKVNELVNAPNWVVSAYLPESIFPG